MWQCTEAFPGLLGRIRGSQCPATWPDFLVPDRRAGCSGREPTQSDLPRAVGVGGADEYGWIRHRGQGRSWAGPISIRSREGQAVVATSDLKRALRLNTPEKTTVGEQATVLQVHLSIFPTPTIHVGYGIGSAG